MQGWLESYVAPNLTPVSAETYKFITNKHILPRLGNILLSNLRSQVVQKLYSDMIKSGLSSATIQKTHNILHKALEIAVKNSVLMRNPLIGVELPKVERPDMITLNETDIHLVLDRARESEYYPLWYTLIFTGLRRGEALALRWSDVDLLMLKASISRSATYLNKKVFFKAPKTKRSSRYISLTPSNAVVLREHYEKQNQRRQDLGLPMLQDNDLVFAHYDGKPYLPNSITHAWIKLVRRCGLPGHRLHDNRHSYASLLLKQNVHPSIVQNQLGHASIKTTLDLYSHVIPALQEQAAVKFDDLVIGKSGALAKR